MSEEYLPDCKCEMLECIICGKEHFCSTNSALEAKVKELTEKIAYKENREMEIESRFYILQSQYAEAVEVLKKIHDLIDVTINDQALETKIKYLLSSPSAKQAIEIRELEQRVIEITKHLDLSYGIPIGQAEELKSALSALEEKK